MGGEIINKYFPQRHDTEDELFIICMSEIKEFPQHITKFDDIIGKYDSRYISNKSYKNLNLDSVRKRKNDKLVNIEHHTEMTSNLMRRDNEYLATIHVATELKVDQFILYTGPLPIAETEIINDMMTYRPNWIITRKIDGNIRLNNIKYKIEHNEKLNVHDIIDLIWLPTFHSDLGPDEIVMEATRLYEKTNTSTYLLTIAKKCLKLWVGRYVKDKKQLKKSRMEVKNVCIRT